MKEIPLTQGKVALVDDEDFEKVNQLKWCLKKGDTQEYAHTSLCVNKKRTSLLMHRMILGVSGRNNYIDHKNRNGLDNQKSNLRICCPSDNSSNKKSAKGSSSKYLGVSWNSNCQKWRVRICKKGKFYSIGLFDSEIEAALAYNEAAKVIHGEFVNPNQV